MPHGARITNMFCFLLVFFEFSTFIETYVYKLMNKETEFSCISFMGLQVLIDWNCGKLRYFTEPPEEENLHDKSSELCSTELLSEMSKEFDLDALDDEQKAVVEGEV